MNPRERESRFPDWKLERFLLGELDPEEISRIQRELEKDEPLQARVEALRQSNQEILERYPAPWMGREIRMKAGEAASPRKSALRESKRLRLWPIPALSMAAAVVLLMLLLPPPGEWLNGGPEQTVVPYIGIKGLEPQLRLYRRTESGSERLASGVTAREHDLILIRYKAAGHSYGVIFSVDGRGSITRHIPLRGEKALQLRQDGAISLDFSYELDDAPRWERFYFVTSDSIFDLNPVFVAAGDSMARLSAANGDSLALPPSLHQTIFTLKKETSHE